MRYAVVVGFLAVKIEDVNIQEVPHAESEEDDSQEFPDIYSEEVGIQEIPQLDDTNNEDYVMEELTGRIDQLERELIAKEGNLIKTKKE